MSEEKNKEKKSDWPPKELEAYHVHSISVMVNMRSNKIKTYKNVAVKLGALGEMSIIMTKDEIIEVPSIRIHEMICKSDSLIYQITLKEMIETWEQYQKTKKIYRDKEHEQQSSGTYG